MNTLNYIGSKQTLCPILTDIISTEIPDLKSMSFLDMFAGTGSVGFRFQEITNICCANDLEYYSFIINSALLKCAYSTKLQATIDHFNTLTGVDGLNGLIYTNYSENNAFHLKTDEYCGKKSFTKSYYFNDKSPDKFYVKYVK